MRDLAADLSACAMNTATIGYREPIAVTIDRVARAALAGFPDRARSAFLRAVPDDAVALVVLSSSLADFLVSGTWSSGSPVLRDASPYGPPTSPSLGHE